ncbi:MAG TPA: hypothetical protein VE030_11355 [Burkholderiales bacterium]|nr:hypothetical protein [Burkholderiales bacterium]
MTTASTTRKCACGRTISGNKLTCAACSKPVATGDGVLEILNVGAGDVKITFNTGDVSDTIRARRIVTDMLRRGFALLVEIERDGERKYERVQAFDEKTGEYLIADFDPLDARQADLEDAATARRLETAQRHGEAPTGLQPPGSSSDLGITVKDIPLCACGRPLHHRGSCKGQKRGYRRVPMEGAKATAVGRSSGG